MTQIALIIRPAQPSDTESIAMMVLAMALESEGLQLSPETVRAGVQAVFEQPSRGTYWVVEADGQLIANTMVTEELSDWHNAPYWWIQSVYVTPGRRGQGVFQALLQAVEAEARKVGAKELRLYVERENERAIRTYEKCGFEGEHYRTMTKRLN